MDIWAYDPQSGHLNRMREEYAAEHAARRPDVIIFFAELTAVKV